MPPAPPSTATPLDAPGAGPKACPEAAPSDLLRDRLLDAAAGPVAEFGWTLAALRRAAEAAGITEAELDLACPRGPADLLQHLSRRAALAAEAHLRSPGVQPLKIREKVTAGVLAYLDALAPFRQALRRAAASPLHAHASPAAVWRAADAVWSGLGDASTDFNWYTKRATLSAVLASTGLCWLAADSDEPVRAFLDRRIEDVMRFEKAKADWRRFTETLPDPLAFHGRRRA